MWQPFSLYGRQSAAGKALVAAQNQDSGEENLEKDIVLRQKQSDENSYADPEHNKTDGFFHKRSSACLISSYFIICSSEENIKKQNFISFLPDIGYNSQ